MSSVFLSIEKSSETSFRVSATAESAPNSAPDVRRATANVSERLIALIEAANFQDDRQSIREELALALGECVFSGEVGTFLRDTIAQGETTAIFLKTDEEHADWPWELSTDASTGIRPALDVGLIRHWGGSHSTQSSPTNALLVVPRNQGAAKVKAVQAATSGLARRHSLDVYPADPATGAGVRRSLEKGATLVHLEADGDGRAHLDDGPVPLSRLGINENTWLALLAGSRNNAQGARGLREGGTPLVIGQQMGLPPRFASAAYRAVYQALGAGQSVHSAVSRARHALLQIGGKGDVSWAAPVLWAAPGEQAAEPALGLFPPPAPREPSTDRLELPDVHPTNFDPYPDLAGPIGSPVAAAVFVNDTLRALLQGLGTESDRIARAAALQSLGAQRLDGEVRSSTDTPDGRIRELTDALVSGLAYPDGPVRRPDGFEECLKNVSEQLAVCPDSLQRAAISVRSSAITCLIADDLAEGRRLAEALCADVYERYPRQTPWHDEARFFTLPVPGSGQKMTSPGGWFYRSIASNWRRDEIDPFQPEQSAPVSRMPVVARRGDEWHIFNGTWLVINGAERLAESTVYALSQSLAAGLFQGITPEGQLCRIPIPKDFRVILVAQWEPAFLPPGTPRVTVSSTTEHDVAIERLLAVTSDRMGTPIDSPSAEGRRKAAEVILETARWLRVATPCSQSMCETALCFAAVTGGQPIQAAQVGLEAVFSNDFSALPPSVSAYVNAVLKWKSPTQIRELAMTLARDGLLIVGPDLRALFPDAEVPNGASPVDYVEYLRTCPDLLFQRDLNGRSE